ncbi:MAG: Sjogren's syndrome/scleroderma autoantigen 1 family protein [Candidatus Bathyarchaeia archaeon]
MENQVKRMAELLKSGATMLSELCPECGNPLFKIKDEIFCVKCNKPVVIVKATESEVKALAPMILAGIEQTILSKIKEIDSMIKEEKDLNKMAQLGSVLSGWLTALERVKKMRESFS